MRNLLIGAVAASAVGCNRYDLFLVEENTQAGGSNQADVLFVVDDSDSMLQESVGMAENFVGFMERLVAREQGRTTDGLDDAAEAYLGQILDPAAYVDIQLGLTTVDALERRGGLIGEPMGSDPASAERFVERLLCEATCFADRQVAPTDPDYVCDEAQPAIDEVSREALDCVCGESAWVGNCGGGTEMGLESAYLAACRAVDDPPEACFETRVGLTEDDVGSHAGFLRPGATFIPVIVTDEGDSSLRMAPTERIPQVYADLFDELGVFHSWAVIGPAVDDDLESICLGPTSWGILRYEYITQGTGGRMVDIHDRDCEPVNFGAALDRVGALIAGEINAYPLAQRPVDGTLVVEVEGKVVDPAEAQGEGLFGETLYGDGWSYEADGNLVRLYGAAQPPPGGDVAIRYLPQAAGK